MTHHFFKFSRLKDAIRSASEFRPPVELLGNTLTVAPGSALTRPARRFISFLAFALCLALPGGSGCRSAAARPASPLAVTVADAGGNPVVIRDASRLVTAGGSITEIVYALEGQSRLVGVDQSSVFPEPATKLPQVGYVRTLSAEGVLSLKPSVFISTAEAGPPDSLAQLRSAGIPVLILSAEHSVEGVKKKIRGVAAALSSVDRGEALVRTLETEIAEAQTAVSKTKSRPKVMFIYARGQGTLNVAGKKTAAYEMIRMAGGANAFDYDNYKPLSAEAVVAAAPDVILLPTRGLETTGGIDGVLKLPGIAQTPAGKARRVVAMDDLLLLGFGPRTGRGVTELVRLLHPESEGK